MSGPSNQNLVISRSDEVMVVERRKYYRLPSRIPLSFRVANAALSGLVSPQAVDSHTQNISEGGLAFATDLPLEVGDELQVNLHLRPSQSVTVDAWVVRSKQIKSGERPLHSVALEFLELQPEVRKQIVPFLAEVDALQARPSSRDKQEELVQKRRSLQKELRLLETMARDTPALAEREKAIKAKIDELNKKLVGA